MDFMLADKNMIPRPTKSRESSPIGRVLMIFQVSRSLNYSEKEKHFQWKIMVRLRM
jgi:hypothetical protein